jgi:hypothetical protein
MFKDFSNLNGVARKAIPPVLSNQLSRGLTLQSGILQRIRDLANEYTSAYNSVSVIKYDESGEPIDVTPSAKMSVPENRLAVVKAWISDARSRLSVIRDLVSESSSTTKDVTFDSAIASSIRYNIAGHLMKRADFSTNFPKNLYGVIPSRGGASPAGARPALMFLESPGNEAGMDSAFVGVTLPDIWKYGEGNLGKALAIWRNNDSFSGVISKTTAAGIATGDLVIIVYIDFHRLEYRISKADFAANTLANLQIPLVSDTVYTQETFQTQFDTDADATGLTDVEYVPFAIETNNTGAQQVTLYQASKGFTASQLQVQIDQLNVDEILIPDSDLASLESAI